MFICQMFKHFCVYRERERWDEMICFFYAPFILHLLSLVCFWERYVSRTIAYWEWDDVLARYSFCLATCRCRAVADFFFSLDTAPNTHKIWSTNNVKNSINYVGYLKSERLLSWCCCRFFFHPLLLVRHFEIAETESLFNFFRVSNDARFCGWCIFLS